jgi:bifunctional enzyme CysN/CysC
MDDAPAVAGTAYWLKLGSRTVAATLAAIHTCVDIATLAELPADRLGLNDIGGATLALDRSVAFDPYADNRDTGGFILIDRTTNATVAAGLILGAARAASNIHWQAMDVDRAGRAAIKGQAPAILWFTGLSGAGKSTIANIVERKLFAVGRHTALLDGDNVRHGLNADLGFSAADRAENIRRVAAVARLMADAGLIVLVSFIAPFRAERAAARAAAGDVEFIEVFVDTPLAEAEKRDAKGLYAKARAGLLPDFTGIGSPYEPPERPEIRLDTTRLTPEAAADLIVDRVVGHGGWDWSI